MLGGGESGASLLPYSMRPCLGTFGDVRKEWMVAGSKESGSKDSWAWSYAPRVAKRWAEDTRTGIALVEEGGRAPFMLVVEQDFRFRFSTGGATMADRQAYSLMQLMVEHHYAMVGVVKASNRLRSVERARVEQGKSRVRCKGH